MTFFSKIAAYFAKRAIMDPEGAANSGKKMIGIIIGIIITLLLVPAFAISLPGLFGKDIDDDAVNNFDNITDSNLYKQIKQVYDEYEDSVQAEIENRIQSLQIANKQASKVQNTMKSSLLNKKLQSDSLFFLQDDRRSIVKIKPMANWNEGECMGTYLITGYCPCQICCGHWANGITSTGATAKAKHTIAVDPNYIPYGTYIKVEGLPGNTFKAEDCGGAIKEKHIDMYFNTHQEALNWGKKYLKLYYVNGEASPDPEAIKNTVVSGQGGDISSSSALRGALAYVLTKYDDIQIKSERFFFRLKLKHEIKKFFDDITTIEVWQEGTPPNITYQTNVTILGAEEIAEKYFKLEEKQGQYLASYESFEDIISDSIAIADGDVVGLDGVELTEITKYACQYIGNRYVYGGTDINNGIDCSAFVQYVYKHFGVSLPRTSREQALVGKGIKDISQAEPGDLLFLSKNNTVQGIYHVMIYIGNGKVVHASNHKPYPAGGIKISNIYKSIYCIRRIAQTT